LHLGSTLIFDIGVMLVVVGTVLLMIFSVEDRLPGLVED
jgi:multicomponent Na+:H+ antiporter subunit B